MVYVPYDMLPDCEIPKNVLLQLAVIEIPFVRSVFSTSELSWAEWLWTALFSLAPLLVHEAVVLVRFLARKIRKA